MVSSFYLEQNASYLEQNAGRNRIYLERSSSAQAQQLRAFEINFSYF